MSTRIITIFGGSGFIGRHLVGRLAAEGHQIRLAVRDTEKAATLMTQGNVGQVVGVQANIRNQASVERAVAGADIVINLVGLLYEAGAQKFNAVHEDGAACVAKAAKAAGASQMVHMSALGADTASKSKYAHTKAVGENAVMKAFDGATIIRPSVVFGAGDNFTNKFAALGSISPAIPLLDGGKNKMQPVSVEDLADAMAKIVLNPEYQGKIWEFGGPDALPLSEIIGIIEKVSKQSSIILPMPAGLMTMMGYVMGLIPGKPMLTTDQVKLLKSHNVVSGDHPGFAGLGIQPTSFCPASLQHLTRFQKGGGYSELHA